MQDNAISPIWPQPVTEYMLQTEYLWHGIFKLLCSSLSKCSSKGSRRVYFVFQFIQEDTERIKRVLTHVKTLCFYRRSFFLIFCWEIDTQLFYKCAYYSIGQYTLRH